MAKKTLFLDFDGVLHPTFIRKGQAFCHMPVLESALIGQPVEIVVSSSWRFHETWEYIVATFPPSIRGQVVGHTGEAHVGRWSRWHEIQAHLSQNRIRDWIALDDAYMEFPPDCPNLIPCDGAIGLQKPQIDALSAWLEVSR